MWCCVHVRPAEVAVGRASGRLEAPTRAPQSHPRPTNAPAEEHKDNLPILSMPYQLH